MSFPEVWISKNNKGYLFKEDAVGGFEGFEHSYPTLEEGLKIYNGFICYYKESKRHENYHGRHQRFLPTGRRVAATSD